MYEKEKSKIKECMESIPENASNIFIMDRSVLDSFFVDYHSSIHIEKDGILEYDSREISAIRALLIRVWENDDIKKQIIPIILAGLLKDIDNTNILPAVSGKNYMM